MVGAEGLLRAHGLGHAERLDGALVAAAGELCESEAAAAEARLQRSARHFRELADGRMPRPSSSDAVTLPTPQSRSDGSGARKAASRPGRHHHEPVGLLEIGRHLGEELVRRHPHRGGQGHLGADPRLDRPARCGGPSPRSARLAVTSRKASSMDTGSSSGVHCAEERHDLARHPRVLVHVHRQVHGVGTEPVGAADGHGGVDAEAARLVGGGGDDAAPARQSAPTTTGRPRSSGRSRCSTDA